MSPQEWILYHRGQLLIGGMMVIAGIPMFVIGVISLSAVSWDITNIYVLSILGCNFVWLLACYWILRDSIHELRKIYRKQNLDVTRE